jgi:hypothetical protein
MLSVTENKYGFTWGEVLVERTAAKDKPKCQILRVFTLTGEVVEITMRPRSTKVEVFPKYED